MSTNWNASMQFPTDSCYINRVTSAKFGQSKSSGNPMITLEMEVISPEEVDIAGQKVNISGIKTTSYYTTKVIEDGEVDQERTENAIKRVFHSDDPQVPSLFQRFGIDGNTVDKDNPDVKQLIGKCVYCQMSSNVEEQRKTPTPEQIETARKNGVTNMRTVGDIMKNPVTGKPLIKYWPKIDEIFGLAPEGAGSNKPY